MPLFNSEYTRLPIRAVYEGIRLENKKLVNFIDVYDFYEFKANTTSKSAFQVSINFNNFLLNI